MLDPSQVQAILAAQTEQRVTTDYGRVAGWRGEASVRLGNAGRTLIRIIAYGAKVKFARPPYQRDEIRAIRAFLRDWGGQIPGPTRNTMRYLLKPATKDKACKAYRLFDGETQTLHPIDVRSQHTVILHRAPALSESLEGVLF